MLSLSDYGARSCLLEIQVKMGPCGHILEHSYLAYYREKVHLFLICYSK